MDWAKVAETLRIIGNNHTKMANDYRMKSGYFDAVKHHELASDIFIGMAAALRSGMAGGVHPSELPSQPYDQSKDPTLQGANGGY